MTVIIFLLFVILIAALYFGMLDRLHLIPRPKPGQLRVACVGDSITYGFLVAGQPWNSYPRQLGRMLGKGCCVANFGFSNRTASEDADYPYTAESLYCRSLAFRPDIVLIMLGSNDTKPNNWNPESYARALSSIADSYLELDTQPRVMLMTPPSVFHFRKKVLWSIQSRVLEEEAVPICRRVAEEKGLPLVDIHSVFIGRGELFVDGCHPNRKGAELLAKTVYKTLAETMLSGD